MADNTKIAWADATINPLGWGCYGPTGTPEQPAPCGYCYAKRLAARHLRECPDCRAFRPHFHSDELSKLARWRKPRRVFVQSMGDLFGAGVKGSTINLVWNAMFNVPRHTYLILTKRPDRLLRWTQIAAMAKAWPIEEIWPDWFHLGVTCETQAAADERIPLLLQTPAAVKWLSIEPLLGPVDLVARFWANEWALGGPHGVSWAVIGNDSTHGARLPDPAWVDAIIVQCWTAGVPVWVKGRLHERWPIQELPEVEP